ncbi:MAG: acyl carrier protein [Phycisphaerae bacterium]
MIAPAHNKLQTDVLDWVRELNLLDRSENVQLTAQTDLFESGVLDSVAFIELIVFLEDRLGRSIDLSEADPSDFSTVAGLCELAGAGRNGKP